MKKKAVAAMLVMCMALSAAACADGEKKETSEKTESSTETAETDTKEETEEKETTASRLVSVKDISKYITVGEYKGLKLDKVAMPVSDVEVDSEIQYRLEEKIEEVQDASVETDDHVTINFTGTIDGESFDGGTEENYEMVVGEAGITEGFDEGLMGMKKGETKEVSVTFPEDYYDTALAGKTAVYQVTMLKISRVPQLTDEWVAANTESKTVAEYRSAVQTELEKLADESAQLQLGADAWNQVYESSEITEFPKEDIESSVEAYKKLNEEYMAQAQVELSEFLESQGMTEEEYEEECTRYAEEKVKQNLIVQYIMDQENLSLEDETAKGLETQLLQQYGIENISELVEFYGQAEVDETLALLRVEKFIVDNAEVSEKVGGGDELAVNEDAIANEDAYDTAEEGFDMTEDSAEGTESTETDADVAVE